MFGRSEPHGAVVQRSIEGRRLSESLFARFLVTDHCDAWGTGDPLTPTQAERPDV